MTKIDPTASIPVRWRLSSLAETDASGLASAPCYRSRKRIGIATIVVAELKFGDVQRQIFAADLVVGANNAALQDRPKAFDSIGVNSADNIVAAALADNPMRIGAAQEAIAGMLIGREQADLI